MKTKENRSKGMASGKPSARGCIPLAFGFLFVLAAFEVQANSAFTSRLEQVGEDAGWGEAELSLIPSDNDPEQAQEVVYPVTLDPSGFMARPEHRDGLANIERSPDADRPIITSGPGQVEGAAPSTHLSQNDILGMFDGPFQPSDGEIRAIAQRNTMSAPSVNVETMCGSLKDENAKAYCARSFAQSNECEYLATNYSQVFLVNQGIHELIQAEIGSHAKDLIARSASAVLSALQEKKIKKVLKKSKQLANESQADQLVQDPAIVELCQVNPQDPACQQVAGFAPEARGFADGGFQFNMGGSPNTAFNGPKTEQEAEKEENTTASPVVAVAPGITTPESSVQQGNGFRDAVPGAAKAGTQATRSTSGGGEGGGGGAPAASAQVSNGSEAPRSSARISTSASYGTASGGSKYGSASGGAKTVAPKGNPFASLFGDKKGAATGKGGELNFRGPASELGDKSTSLFDRISGRFQKAVEEKRINASYDSEK